MAKKSAMQKEVEKTEGEQMALIDVGPENIKAIKGIVELYQESLAARLHYLAEEVKYKKEILRLVRKAKLKPLDNGEIKFKCDGFLITITPRDVLVKVKGQKKKNRSPKKGL